METYNAIIEMLAGIVWHDSLIALLVCVGIYFTIRIGFWQFTSLPLMVRLMTKSKASERGISSFQAFLTTVAGRVGIGNIAGTAVAIYMGGPGAVFWMWLIALVGSASAFIESTLAQIYKTEVAGQYVGGPAQYAKKALGIEWYGTLIAIILIFSCIIGSPGIQSNVIADSMKSAFNIPELVTGFIVAIALGWVVFGGIKRIAEVSEILVPIMCIVYIFLAIIIVIANITKLPAIIGLIFSSAFGLNPAFAGITGSAISWGVKRGVYSNEAGLGAGAPAAAAAEVSHPAEQGLVQACSVFVDTLLVCSATAFLILTTGKYNILGPDGKTMIIENLPGIDAGPGYVQAALATLIPFGEQILAFIITLFAFTCLYGYYYQAEAAISSLTEKSGPTVYKITILVARIVIVINVLVSSQFEAVAAWNLADIGGGILAWAHIILLLLICKPAIIAAKDYKEQYKKGIIPVFEPDKLGIKNAEIWNEINKRQQISSS
ncbi:alanine/glycine:cation symporter family protein [Tepidanaerobacter sp. EBM-49]|uniref:alanine/glycine:cation symporter family protein n=1 Tax=Tepidanaerobacter sp. EBM-49 TaxID=1918504 RepID=UPI000A9A9F3A|nr:alanine/glycine:cation symporter family protein [Tepidanaerobacter sp. EBM-49]